MAQQIMLHEYLSQPLRPLAASAFHVRTNIHAIARRKYTLNRHTACVGPT
jgi:hypothetical protein